jgi:hypothetical protein
LCEDAHASCPDGTATTERGSSTASTDSDGFIRILINGELNDSTSTATATRTSLRHATSTTADNHYVKQTFFGDGQSSRSGERK